MSGTIIYVGVEYSVSQFLYSGWGVWIHANTQYSILGTHLTRAVCYTDVIIQSYSIEVAMPGTMLSCNSMAVVILLVTSMQPAPEEFNQVAFPVHCVAGAAGREGRVGGYH